MTTDPSEMIEVPFNGDAVTLTRDVRESGTWHLSGDPCNSAIIMSQYVGGCHDAMWCVQARWMRGTLSMSACAIANDMDEAAAILARLMCEPEFVASVRRDMERRR